MILPLLLAALVFATLGMVLAPLLMGSRPGLDRARYDQAVYRDQLRELDRDVARGQVTPDEAAAARLEIQRRLLATNRPVVDLAPGRSSSTEPALGGARSRGLASTSSPADDVRLGSLGSGQMTAASTAAATHPSRSPVLAGVLFVVIASGSIGLYLRLGAPGVPDEPFAGRQADGTAVEGKERLVVERATDQLAARLKSNPADPGAWLLYARSLVTLNRWAEAEDAFGHAIALGENGPEVTVDHAETLVLAAGGTVTPAAEAAFRQILANDPRSGVARYYLAVAASQGGEPRKAIDMLQALLADMPADSPLRGQIGQRVADAAQAAHVPVPDLAAGAAPASGPDANAVASAAQMSDEQRQAMIRGMVLRLAAKQQDDPGNLEGWLQLARAYSVLHEPDKAADAYEAAARLKPGDVAIPLQEARSLLVDHEPADKLPARVVGLLKRVEATDPQEPFVLWFLGIAAAQARHPDEARQYWNRLLTGLPAGSEDAHMVQNALDTLAPDRSPNGTQPTGVSPAEVSPNGTPPKGNARSGSAGSK